MLRAPFAILSGGALFCAVWTIGSNVATLGRLHFSALFPALVAAILAGAAGARNGGRLEAVFTAAFCGQAPALRSRTEILAAQSLMRIVPAGALCGAAFLYFVWKGVFWPLHSALLLSAIATLATHPNSAPPEGARSVDEAQHDALQFGVLLVFLFGLYFLTSWPDGDDAFYVNLPIGMKAATGALMAGDTMFGAGAPLLAPTYRIESLPTLVAVFSKLTGLPAIIVAHAVLPAFALLMYASLSYALFRPMFGAQWLAASALLVAVYLAMDGSRLSYGAHGLFRLYHGKALLVTIWTPLIAALAYAAHRLRSFGAVVFLVAAEIAAVGATANAIYIAPLAAGLVAAAFFLDWNRGGRAFSFLVLGATAYPLLAGLYFVAFDPPVPDLSRTHLSLGDWIWGMFTTKLAISLAFAIAFLGATCAALFRGARLGALYCAAVLALVINPALADLYSEHVTGNLDYRLFWAMPFPLIAATIAFASARAGGGWGLAALGAAASIFLFAPSSLLREGNGVRYGIALRKVDTDAFKAAELLAKATPAGARALAPVPVSLNLPMIEGAPAAVIVRSDYLAIMRPRWSDDAVDGRVRIGDWIMGVEPLDDSLAQILIAEFCVGAAAIAAGGESAGWLSAQLQRLGGAPAGGAKGYDFYVFSHSPRDDCR